MVAWIHPALHQRSAAGGVAARRICFWHTSCWWPRQSCIDLLISNVSYDKARMASRVPGSVSNRADLVCDTHRHLHNIQQEFKHRLHLSHYHAILKWYLSIRIDVGGIVSELQEVISANSALLQYLTVFALLSSRQHQKAAKPNLRLYVGKWELPHCQWKKKWFSINEKYLIESVLEFKSPVLNILEFTDSNVPPKHKLPP